MNGIVANQHERFRRTLENALEGTHWVDSHEEPERLLIIDGRRDNGTYVGIRFLGVRETKASARPAEGAKMRLLGVGSATAFSWRMLMPWTFNDFSASRVRIDAGGARLEVVCEDVEWWQDEAPLPGTT